MTKEETMSDMTLEQLDELMQTASDSTLSSSTGHDWIQAHRGEFVKLLDSHRIGFRDFLSQYPIKPSPYLILQLIPHLSDQQGTNLALLLNTMRAKVDIALLQMWYMDYGTMLSLSSTLKQNVGKLLAEIVFPQGWRIGTLSEQHHKNRKQLIVRLDGALYIKNNRQNTYSSRSGRPEAGDLVAFNVRDTEGFGQARFVNFYLLRRG